MVSHKFGGAWTAIKLDLVKRYFRFYTVCLKNQPFKLIYIDAFAGSGDCEITTEDGPEVIDGSARLALNNDPPFHEYHFIENDHDRFSALEKLQKHNSDKKIYLYNADANTAVMKVCRSINWRNTRATMFLDPYGMHVNWEMLVEIANTKAIDLWYLLPLSGIYRQAANNYDNVDKHKAAALDALLGTTEWRNAFYSEDPQSDMFNEEPSIIRTAGVKDIVRYSRERLQTIFAEVPEPRILPETGPPRFALFFAVANPRAATLSIRAANHILKM